MIDGFRTRVLTLWKLSPKMFNLFLCCSKYRYKPLAQKIMEESDLEEIRFAVRFIKSARIFLADLGTKSTP